MNDELCFWLPLDFNASYCERAKRRLRDWITNRNVQGELWEAVPFLAGSAVNVWVDGLSSEMFENLAKVGAL